MEIKIPDGYKSILSVYDTQKAISLLKRLFEDRLAALLNLYRVSAPLFVDSNSGLNDNLNGYERPVSFDILRSDTTAQVVQSLAKWKRLALKLRQALKLGIDRLHRILRIAQGLDYVHNGELEIVEIAVFRKDDLFPVPLVNID